MVYVSKTFNYTYVSLAIFKIYAKLIKEFSYFYSATSNQNLFNFTAAGVAAVKRLPVHHHSEDTIAWSFGIIKFNFSHLKIEFRLMYPDTPVLCIYLLKQNKSYCS